MELINNQTLATPDGYLIGGEFEAQGTGAFIYGGLKASISGPHHGSYDVLTFPGATYTVSVSVASRYVQDGYETPGDTALSLRIGTQVLETITDYTPGNAPTTALTVTATVPADYVFDGTNGINFLVEPVMPPYSNGPMLWVAGPSLSTDYTAPGGEPTPEPVPVPEPAVNVLAARAAAFIGRAGSKRFESLAAAQLPIVTEFVRGYTRDRGFYSDGEPMPPLEAVLVSVVSRLLTNPEQVTQYQTGDYSERPAVLNGWTLTELAILNRYRRRAA